MKENKESKIEEKINKDVVNSIRVRLDALIRLFVEMNKTESKKGLTEAAAARILKSVGLTPTEIAKILGKKSATDVSSYLYPKKKKTKKW